MKISDLKNTNAPKGLQSDMSPKALEMWNPSLQMAALDDPENTITIYEPIGFDFWTGDGVTAKRIAAALRNIGPDNDVIVNINSPGGDVFEALAIYNLLKEHSGKITVNILGLAASAASFIAMAGDEIRIGRAAFFMIHNAWVCACGNRNFLREIADWLEPFDFAIADVYQVRTEIDTDEIIRQMDAESWIGGKEAVDQGWADDFLASDAITEKAENRSERVLAARRVEAAMIRAGIPRSERRSMINDLKSSTPSAAGGGTPGATVADKPSAVAIVMEPLHRISFDPERFSDHED